MSLPTITTAQAQPADSLSDATVRASVAVARVGTSFVWDWPTAAGATFTITATDQTETAAVVTTHASAQQTVLSHYVVSSVSADPSVTQSCIEVVADDNVSSGSRCVDVVPSGDANCDEQITAADALAIAGTIVGLTSQVASCPLEQGQISLADADADGDALVTLTDALLVAQCAAGRYNAWCNEPAFDVATVTLPPEFLAHPPPAPAGPVTVSVSGNQATVDFSGLQPAAKFAAVVRVGNLVVAEDIVTTTSMSATLPAEADYPDINVATATICAAAVPLTGAGAGSEFGGAHCLDRSPLTWSQQGALQPYPVEEDGSLRRGPDGEYLDVFRPADVQRCARIPWNAKIVGPGDTTAGAAFDVSQPGNVTPPTQFIWVPRWFNPYARSGVAAVPPIEDRQGVAVGVKPSFLEFFPPDTPGSLVLGPEPRTFHGHFYPRIEAPDGEDWGGRYWPIEIHTNTLRNDSEYGWGYSVVWDLNQLLATRPYVREPCRVLVDPEMYYDERRGTGWEIFVAEVIDRLQEYCDARDDGDNLATCVLETAGELLLEFVPGRECVRWLLNEGGTGRSAGSAAVCLADGLGPALKFLRPLDEIPIVVTRAGEIVEVYVVSGEEIYQAWEEAKLDPEFFELCQQQSPGSC